MEKNIAAIIQDNTKTIQVRFPQEDKEIKTLLGSDDSNIGLSDKAYTYVTNLDISVDDLVVVPAVGEYKLVVVVDVHDDLLIEPNEAVEYEWVVSKIDFSYFKEQMGKNLKIKQTMSTAYKKSARQQAKAIMLASLPEAEVAALQDLLK